jgi:hypothetical protein
LGDLGLFTEKTYQLESMLSLEFSQGASLSKNGGYLSQKEAFNPKMYF